MAARTWFSEYTAHGYHKCQHFSCPWVGEDQAFQASAAAICLAGRRVLSRNSDRARRSATRASYISPPGITPLAGTAQRRMRTDARPPGGNSVSKRRIFPSRRYETRAPFNVTDSTPISAGNRLWNRSVCGTVSGIWIVNSSAKNRISQPPVAPRFLACVCDAMPVRFVQRTDGEIPRSFVANSFTERQ